MTDSENGSALVIAVIVLAILGVIGFTALEVSELNIFMAANDRDTKDAFFHADSGANIGRELVKKAFDEGNSTFYNDDATLWVNDNFTPADFPYKYDVHNSETTYLRAGLLGIKAEGVAVIIGAGYEGFGKGLPHGFEAHYLIRSHREGRRNSRAEVDIGWRDIDN